MTPRRFAVLGDPIAHSKSPKMHAAAYRALGLPHTYEAIRATPDDLPALVRALREGVYDGFNVTVPHKQRVLEHVDSVHPSASAVGAANTLVRAADGRIVAHNTDVPALARELARLAPERTGDEWAASSAVVLGSGGAARAAIAALATDLRVASVHVRARSLDAIVRDASAPITAGPLAPSPAHEARVLTVVQATSAGMTGAASGDAVVAALAWDALPSSAVVLDVVYAPPVTPLLHAASARGLRTANGLGMLAAQGALAFELWLGVPAPYEVMRSALE